MSAFKQAQRRYDNELPEAERNTCEAPCSRCGSSATLFGDETDKNCYAGCNGCGRRPWPYRWTLADAEEDWNEWNAL